MSDTPETTTPSIANPLANTEKAAIYYATDRPLGDPQREAVKAEVQRYFEATYDTTPIDTTPFHMSSDEVVLDANPATALKIGGAPKPAATAQPASSQPQQSDAGPDAEYWATAPVKPERINTIQAEMNVAAAEHGDTAQMDTWVKFGRAVGQDEAAEALVELREIEGQWHNGSWRHEADIRARVYELNRIVDKARLAWAATRVGR
jgi:hypothetical protein